VLPSWAWKKQIDLRISVAPETREEGKPRVTWPANGTDGSLTPVRPVAPAHGIGVGPDDRPYASDVACSTCNPPGLCCARRKVRAILGQHGRCCRQTEVLPLILGSRHMHECRDALRLQRTGFFGPRGQGTSYSMVLVQFPTTSDTLGTYSEESHRVEPAASRIRNAVMCAGEGCQLPDALRCRCPRQREARRDAARDCGATPGSDKSF
jgi:hypothetical protein